MHISHLDELPQEPTSHAGILRSVLLSERELPHGVRLSHAVFKPGESIEAHRHNGLNEVFYFLFGTGLLIVNEQPHAVRSGTAVCVSAGEEHRLINTGNDDMAVLYFALPAA